MIAFFLVLVSALSAHADESSAVVQLKPVVQVGGEKASVFFSDLLNAHGLTTADLEEISKIEVTETPKVNETRAFSKSQIEDLLREPIRLLQERKGQKIALRVPPRITISRKSLRLATDAVEAELKTQLKARCTECRFDIANLKLPIISDRGATGWSIKLRGEIPRGGFSLPLNVQTETGERVYWISGQITVMKSVPVLSRAVEIGEKLLTEDFVFEEKDVTFSSDQPATPAEMEASVTSRQMAAGQILWRNGLKRELALKVGESVKVVSGGESEDAVWQISIDGIAQSAGYVGETVKVKIPKTQKLISGLLKEKGLVEVR